MPSASPSASVCTHAATPRSDGTRGSSVMAVHGCSTCAWDSVARVAGPAPAVAGWRVGKLAPAMQTRRTMRCARRSGGCGRYSQRTVRGSTTLEANASALDAGSVLMSTAPAHGLEQAPECRPCVARAVTDLSAVGANGVGVNVANPNSVAA